MAARIKVITFHSEGPPHDEGMALTEGAKYLGELVESQGCVFDAYTPSRLRELDAENLVRKFDDRYALKMNPGLHAIGMAAWKPFIMLHALEDMNAEDVLVYSDANIRKYPGLATRLSTVQAFVDETISEYSFFVGRERPDQQMKAAHHASANQILQIGCNTIFACNFPVHIVNRLVVRKTDESLRILTYWLALCLEERFMLPPLEGEVTHPDFRWFCPEQSVLNMILANLIEEGKLPYYYAGIGIDRQGTRFVADTDHVSALSAPTLKPDYISFEQRFVQHIAAAEKYVAARRRAQKQVAVCREEISADLEMEPVKPTLLAPLQGDLAVLTA